LSTRWIELFKFSTVQSLARHDSPSRSRTCGCSVVVFFIGKRRNRKRNIWIQLN